MKNILFIMPFGLKDETNYDKIYEDLSVELQKLEKNVSIHRVDFMKSTNIDSKMYKGIIAADVVVADLTTLNANVLYELGIRHSFADKTTKLIINKEQIMNKIPFDINHLVVHAYVLSYDRKIVDIEELCKKILEEETETDSIIFKTLPDLKRSVNPDYMKVFDKWTKQYTEFIKKIFEWVKTRQEWVSDNYFDSISKSSH